MLCRASPDPTVRCRVAGGCTASSTRGQPRARVAARDAATDRALARPAEVQHALGAAERDVEQALLLVHRLGRLGVRDRHQPAFEPGDEHGVELEALGAVEREQLDGVALRCCRRRRRGATVWRNSRKPSTLPRPPSASRYSWPSRTSASTCSRRSSASDLGVGGEVGEVLGERPARVLRGRWCAAGRAPPAPRAGRGTARRRGRGTGRPHGEAPPRTAPTAR